MPKTINLQAVVQSYVSWAEEQGGSVTSNRNPEGDYLISRNGGLEVTLYLSEIDNIFYGQDQALFVEAAIEKELSGAELKEALTFVCEELVLARINCSQDQNEQAIYVVDCGMPASEVSNTLLDMAIREVSSTTEDIRTKLGLIEESLEA